MYVARQLTYRHRKAHLNAQYRNVLRHPVRMLCLIVCTDSSTFSRGAVCWTSFRGVHHTSMHTHTPTFVQIVALKHKHQLMLPFLKIQAPPRVLASSVSFIAACGASSTHSVACACRYYLQGYCREGNKCRFGHNQQDTGVGFLASQAPSAAHSPSSLTAPTQMPFATLVDPAVSFQAGSAAPTPPPAPLTIPDPVLSPNYGSATGFFFNRSTAFPTGALLQPARPSTLDVGGVGTVFSTAMHGMTSYLPSTPTEASSRTAVNPAAQKQSPFPGMGAGVPGSSAFKHAGSLSERFDTWPAS